MLDRLNAVSSGVKLCRADESCCAVITNVSSRPIEAMVLRWSHEPSTAARCCPWPAEPQRGRVREHDGPIAAGQMNTEPPWLRYRLAATTYRLDLMSVPSPP